MVVGQGGCHAALPAKDEVEWVKLGLHAAPPLTCTAGPALVDQQAASNYGACPQLPVTACAARACTARVLVRGPLVLCRARLGNSADVSKGLRQLYASGAITRTGQGGRHGPFQYHPRYAWVEAAPDTQSLCQSSQTSCRLEF